MMCVIQSTADGGAVLRWINDEAPLGKARSKRRATRRLRAKVLQGYGPDAAAKAIGRSLFRSSARSMRERRSRRPGRKALGIATSIAASRHRELSKRGPSDARSDIRN